MTYAIKTAGHAALFVALLIGGFSYSINQAQAATIATAGANEYPSPCIVKTFNNKFKFCGKKMT